MDMNQHGREIYVPPSGPPQVERPNPAIYEAMGQENIFKMSEDFYALLAESAIKDMFPEDMVKASQKQAKFMVSVLGGPPLYMMEYGHPRMRQRHLPFQISEAARQTWLGCFKKVLAQPEKYDIPEEHLSGFINFLDEFSRWMVNKA